MHIYRYYLLLLPYIYNGNIFPSLNPANFFQFISRWTESTKSSAVGPNHRAVINTSNEVKSPLLWEFWIYNFSLRILERVLVWKHCKYKEWVSFFLGSWGMNRSAEQTNRPRTASRFTRFVCPVLRFIPHEPRKKDTHSLNNVILCKNRIHVVSKTFKHTICHNITPGAIIEDRNLTEEEKLVAGVHREHHAVTGYVFRIVWYASMLIIP